MKHTIAVGDTRTPLGVTLKQSGKPVDLASATVKFEMYDAAGTAIVEETSDNVTKQPTFTFTLDSTNEWLVANDHRAVNDDQVILAGTLTSSGLATATRYFVVNATPNNFQLALTPGGSPIDIEGAGSGTLTAYIVGSCQYDFQSDDVDSAGTFKAWFSVHESDEFDHFPNNDDGITVEIVGVP